MNTIKVYSPVPDEGYGLGRMAPRVAELAGLRVGFLGNLKPNCDVLLHTTAENMRTLGVGGTLYREKESCSLPAPAGMLDELAATCHAAVVALGD